MTNEIKQLLTESRDEMRVALRGLHGIRPHATDHGNKLTDLIMKIEALLRAGVVMLLLMGCYDKNDVYNALDSHGFTHVQTEWGFFGCSEHEWVTNFTANNAAGKPVEGVVCCGWTKRCTVRF